jgi:CheY-like chemotaxis protein
MVIAGKCSQKRCFVLIAEDDDDDRMIFEETLGELAKGVDFAFVQNGQELIDYLSAGDSFPDVIFLDLNMPLMDGRDALKVIRSDPKLKDLPVVCFTTSSSMEDRRLCVDHGAVFHTKPTRISEFYKLIESQLGIL